MRDLKALALLFWQRLVVGDLQDDPGNLGTELRGELPGRGIGVFDGVVKQRSGENDRVGDVRLVRQDVGNRDRVVDVGAGFGALAALVAVLVGRERARCQDD